MLKARFATVAAALIAALLMAGTISAKELKPKFGDIDGLYYTDVAGNREACRQAIRNKIALCRQNTNFESNTKNRKYKGCLPIFRQQAQSCVVHFRHQMSKCNLSGAARITDFTGFSCTATATVVEEGDGPDIAPLDRRMTARTGSNLRAGPGTNHRIVGSLRTGQDVQVTGRTGDWLRIAAPGGGTAFVHGSLLVGAAPAQRGQSDGRTAPESARVNPALAAASRRCEAANSRAIAALTASISCRGNTRCKPVRRRMNAAYGKMGNACCGAFRASSPREELMVYSMKRSCGRYKRLDAFTRCMRGSGPSTNCMRHMRRR